MSSTKKRIGLAAIVLVLLIALFGAVYVMNGSKAQAGSKNITVEVTHSDGSVKTFEYATDDEYLGDLLVREGLIVGDEGEYGLYVTEVDGEEAIYEENSAYWALYVNGEYGTTGVDTTPITDGDTYGWVYTVD